jgi:DNA-binding IclR family transcriptional regulator
MTSTTMNTGAETAMTRRVKSAERTLELLDVLSRASEPLSVAELHRTLGYPRSSFHQLIHTMTDTGWVEVAPDGRVMIGPRALAVGTSYLDRDAALPVARIALERLRDSTGYTAHYARLDGAHVLYLDSRYAHNAARATSRVGRHLPATATSLGKALLAELSDAELGGVLPPEPYPALTPHSITTHERLSEDLRRIRLDGFALEEEENTLGVTCIAAAIPYRIPATDAISCSMPISHATAEERARVARIVTTTARDLAAELRSQGLR